MEIPRASDGGADWDQLLGSILERWLTTRIPGKCRFCRSPLSARDSKEGFCGLECQANWKKVFEARLVIGKRDVKQRGYD
jgi:hypothetical protein